MVTQTITLLSDWGIADHYAAVVREKLYSSLPECRVVDISHQVPLNDIYAAAYILLDAYRCFPEGTIHIIGVDDIASTATPHVVMQLDNHFFIGADNGIFSVLKAISGKSAQQIHEIEIWQETEIYTFPARDLFPKVAALIANGTALSQIGPAVELQQRTLASGLFVERRPIKDGEETIGLSLSGKVLYIDHFGNIVTNISVGKFAACRDEFPFAELRLGWKSYKDAAFAKAYMDVKEGGVALIFLENGLLEISINRAHAANLMGVNRNTKVELYFGQVKK